MLPKPNMTRTGTFPFAFAGRTTAILMSTVTAGWALLSTWPTTRRAATGCPARDVCHIAAPDRLAAERRLHRLGDRPRAGRHVPGNAAVDLALEVGGDLGATLLQPLLRRRGL